MTMQLSLFDAQPDERPLPLIIAGDSGFNLAYVDRDGNPDNYLYSVQDWLRGLTGDDDSRDQWLKIKARLKKSTVVQNTTVEKLPYKATNGKTYKMEFTNDYGLYAITMRLNKSRPNVEATLNQFASHVKFADWVRRNPEEASQRLKGIVKRKEFAAAAHDTNINKRPLYGVLTDTQYKALFGMIAKQLEAELGGKVRDQLGDLSLRAITNAEDNAAFALRIKGELLTDGEQINICYQCAMIEARSLNEYCEFMQVDRLRNRPLLARGGAR